MQDVFSREHLRQTFFSILRVEYRDACKGPRGLVAANLDAIVDNALPVTALPDILNALELRLRRTLLHTDARAIMMDYSSSQGKDMTIGDVFDLIWELCLTSPRPASPATQYSAHHEVPPSPLAHYLPPQQQQPQSLKSQATPPSTRRGRADGRKPPEKVKDHSPLIMYHSPAPPRTQRVPLFF